MEDYPKRTKTQKRLSRESQRLATEEETEEFEKNINYKYIVKCGKCGHEWKYMRMCNVVKHAEKCKCGKCNEPLKRIK